SVRTGPRDSRTWIVGCTTTGVPLIHVECRVGAAAGKGRDRKNVACCVQAVESSGTVRSDHLLEEPDSDVGVAIHGETLSAENEDLMSRKVRVRGGVAVCKGVLVRRRGVRPLPIGYVERVFGTAGLEVLFVGAADEEPIRIKCGSRPGACHSRGVSVSRICVV